MSQETTSKWRCLECKSKQPKTDNTNTPVRTAHLLAMEEENDVSPNQDSHVTIRRNRPVEKINSETF